MRREATKKELAEQVAELRARLEEAEETLRAIRKGEVDALIVEGAEGPQIFTLKGADHTYRVLIEAMDEAASVLADDGTLLYANRCFAKMLKTPLEKLIGHSILPFIGPKDQATFEALIREGRKGTRKGEIALKTGGGNLLPAYVTVNTIELDQVCRIGLVITDLTEQKRNEEIVAAEKLARSILEQAAEAIVVCDEGGRIIRASRMAHRLCDKNPIFQPFDAVFPLYLSPKGSAVISEAPGGDQGRPFSIASVLKGEAIQGVEARFEKEDGERFDLLVSAGVLFGAGSRRIGCVVTLTNISERKRAEEELKRKTLEAQEASRLKSYFVSNVSHELRTPLNSIIGYTYLLLGGTYGSLDEAQRTSLEAVSRNAKELLILVNDILNLSRIESGKLSLEVDSVRLRPLVEEALTAVKPLLTGKSLALQVKFAPGIGPLQTDGFKVKQILINLLSNAVKFTQNGKITLRVENRPEKKGIEMVIEDTGIGIPPEQLSKIFDPFYQADGDMTREYGGVGLGLTIVKELVAHLQGDIQVESQYGDGSTFTVFLPYRIEV
ncbi:PAS domain-containing sensor histidine kinase [Candidatus Manganitrophus noduliformans]|uniref:histidine kinase n=1 Tax=Candidatus Manganitrophus noduliformans TaxID=2606439 RepID=A0A7X6DUD0_9BACT|nr:ATP-binding protein [Candidatus Manganitrophus noduliformans]NKE73324.1 PAS domain S-box protein [Candidatus Manganitrophus noduliformans]